MIYKYCSLILHSYTPNKEMKLNGLDLYNDTISNKLLLQLCLNTSFVYLLQITLCPKPCKKWWCNNQLRLCSEQKNWGDTEVQELLKCTYMHSLMAKKISS